jgi:cytochrome c oxidase assembly protein subunit 15
MNRDELNPTYSRWPHFWGLALAFVAFVLIWFGGLVTTTDAGMAVPDWPNTYNYNMFAYPIYDWFFGPWDLFVEHGHRLLATLAGLLAIITVVATFWCEPRRAVKGFSVVLLMLVIGQGVLGGVRVLADDRAMAKLHGCVGAFFFVMVVAFCAMTSRWYFERGRDANRPLGSQGRLRYPLALTGLVASYLQLVVGAFIRHVGAEASPKMFKHLVYTHIGLALLILALTWFYAMSTRRARMAEPGFRRPVHWLLVLVSVQVLLGFSAWILKYSVPFGADRWELLASYVIPEKTFLQTILVTIHMATGSLILAGWTVMVVRLWRFKTLVKNGQRADQRDILANAAKLEMG